MARFDLTLTINVDDEYGLIAQAQRRQEYLNHQEAETLLNPEAALSYLGSTSDLHSLVEYFGEIEKVECKKDIWDDWTPESIVQLIILWTLGVTVAEIGRRTGFTKKAVSAQVRRLDLPNRRLWWSIRGWSTP